MKTKYLIVMIVLAVVLAIIVPSVNATMSQEEINNILAGGNGTTTDNNTIGNIQEIPGSNNTTISNNVPSNNNVSGLPNTGVDYSILLVIAICGVSAIYAYKKIRDYNVK